MESRTEKFEERKHISKSLILKKGMKFVNKISPMTTEWKEGHQCLMKS